MGLGKASFDGPVTEHKSPWYLMADIEPVDPRLHIEESCKPNCVKPLLQYQACGKRVEADETGHKHCTGQYFDFLSCIDKCAVTKIFSNLK